MEEQGWWLETFQQPKRLRYLGLIEMIKAIRTTVNAAESSLVQKSIVYQSVPS